MLRPYDSRGKISRGRRKNPKSEPGISVNAISICKIETVRRYQKQD